MGETACLPFRVAGRVWDVTGDLGWYDRCRTGAAPWVGELATRHRIAAADTRADWRPAVLLGSARYWAALGFLLGEQPRIDWERPAPGGGLLVRVVGLVTVPPYWSGPPEVAGQGGLWDFG